MVLFSQAAEMHGMFFENTQKSSNTVNKYHISTILMVYFMTISSSVVLCDNYCLNRCQCSMLSDNSCGHFSFVVVKFCEGIIFQILHFVQLHNLHDDG